MTIYQAKSAHSMSKMAKTKTNKSIMWFEIAGVFDVTNYLVTNHINVPVGFNISLTGIRVCFLLI